MGGHLINAAKNKFELYATFHKHPPDHAEIDWIDLDLMDAERLEKIILSINPKYIIHTAAMARADECERRKIEAERVNVAAAEAIAKAGKTVGGRILFISTDLIFNGRNAPYDENDVPDPLNYYGWTKWKAENKVIQYNQDHVIVRPGIMFGPPAIQGTSFSEWMRSSWMEKKETPLFIDQYRTPIYAGTLSTAIVELTTANFNGCLNLAGRKRLSRYEFGLMLGAQLEIDDGLIKPVKVEEVSVLTERPKDVSLKIDRALLLLNMKFPGIKEDIAKAYPHY